MNPPLPATEPSETAPAAPSPDGRPADAAGGLERYARQSVFAGVGEEGQQKLRQSRVTLVGCGALGTVLANVLARAGVGFLRIVDRDYVELTNLQRQVLFDERDARDASPKATAAIEQLQRANSDVTYEAVIADFGADNAEQLIGDVDLVLDGTDNLETRYVINDACVKLGKPWVYAAAVASYGALMPIIPGQTPCLRCVFPDQPDVGSVDTCDTTGVLGAMTGIVANMASIEAIKLLIGAHDRLNRGLTWVDCWYNLFERTPVTSPVADCPTCQQRQFTFLETPAWKRAATMCGRDAVQIRPPTPVIMDLAGLAARLGPLGDVKYSPHALRLVMSSHELTVFRDGRAIIKGTSEIAVARSLYARLVGT